MSNQGNNMLQRYLPIVVGLLLILLFARLGMWQLDRAAEKKALADAFANPANVTIVTAELQPEQYQQLAADGRYLADRQVLVDNVVLNGRLGYYVITAMELPDDAPLLLVNRGWVAKDPSMQALPSIDVGGEPRQISGKTGRLPRVGIRPGEAFVDRVNWPRVGVWPTNIEVAAELGRDVLPFVLLLDPAADDGFVRAWQPRESGTSTHYGYAFQWFALATAVAVIMVLLLRRKRKKDDRPADPT